MTIKIKLVRDWDDMKVVGTRTLHEICPVRDMETGELRVYDGDSVKYESRIKSPADLGVLEQNGFICPGQDLYLNIGGNR